MKLRKLDKWVSMTSGKPVGIFTHTRARTSEQEFLLLELHGRVLSDKQVSKLASAEVSEVV
jgi:hypothetical protein